MARVTVPLGLMGASFATAPGGRLPLTMTGRCPEVPLRYVLPGKQAAYDAKYSTQIRGGESFFRQVDR